MKYSMSQTLKCGLQTGRDKTVILEIHHSSVERTMTLCCCSIRVLLIYMISSLHIEGNDRSRKEGLRDFFCPLN